MPLTVAVPCAGALATATDVITPLSLAATGMVTACCDGVVALSSTATGTALAMTMV
ncbi:hypothetical protein D3C81_1612890 [compost metagenome]